MLLGVSCSALAASSATSQQACVSNAYGGHNYCWTSTVYTNESGSPSDWASSQWHTAGGEQVPAGYVGINARKFKNGSLCEQTGLQYLPVSGSGEQVFAQNTACGAGTYYSFGVIAIWNGNGYNDYTGYQSRSLNG